MALFAHSYQGGPSFEVFSAHGSNPTSRCKIYGGKAVQKVYDKSVRGFVYACSGGASSKMQFPKDEKKAGLLLQQPYLVFQIFIPSSQHFSIELSVTEASGSKQKMYFSTSFSEMKATPLHCQVPLTMVKRNTWLTLVLDVPDILSGCFRGSVLRCVDVVVLGSVFKLRKIFTLRCRPLDLAAFDGDGRKKTKANGMIGEPIPQEHSFATGVESFMQILDMSCLNEALNIRAGSMTEANVSSKTKVDANGSRLFSSAKAGSDGPVQVGQNGNAKVQSAGDDVQTVEKGMAVPPHRNGRGRVVQNDRLSVDESVDEQISMGHKGGDVYLPTMGERNGSGNQTGLMDQEGRSRLKSRGRSVMNEALSRKPVDAKALGGRYRERKQESIDTMHRQDSCMSSPEKQSGFVTDKKVVDNGLLSLPLKSSVSLESRRQVTPRSKRASHLNCGEHVAVEDFSWKGSLVNKLKSKRVYCQSVHMDAPHSDFSDRDSDSNSNHDLFLEEHHKRLMQATTPSGGKYSGVEVPSACDPLRTVKESEVKVEWLHQSDSIDMKSKEREDQIRSKSCGRMIDWRSGSVTDVDCTVTTKDLLRVRGGRHETCREGSPRGLFSSLYSTKEGQGKLRNGLMPDGLGRRRASVSSPSPCAQSSHTVVKARSASSTRASSQNDDSGNSGRCRRCSLYEMESADDCGGRGSAVLRSTRSPPGDKLQCSRKSPVAESIKISTPNRMQSPWRGAGRPNTKVMGNGVRTGKSLDSGSSYSGRSSPVCELESAPLQAADIINGIGKTRHSCLSQRSHPNASSSSVIEQSVPIPEGRQSPAGLPIPSKRSDDPTIRLQTTSRKATPSISRSLSKRSISTEENVTKVGVRKNSDLGLSRSRSAISTRMRRSCDLGSVGRMKESIRDGQMYARKSHAQLPLEKREVGVHDKKAIMECSTTPQNGALQSGKVSALEQKKEIKAGSVMRQSRNGTAELFRGSGSKSGSPHKMTGCSDEVNLSVLKAKRRPGGVQARVMDTRQKTMHEEFKVVEWQGKCSSDCDIAEEDGLRCSFSPNACSADVHQSGTPPKTPPDLLSRVSRSYSTRVIIRGEMDSASVHRLPLERSHNAEVIMADQGRLSYTDRRRYLNMSGTPGVKSSETWDGCKSLDSDDEFDQGSPIFQETHASETATMNRQWKSLSLDGCKEGAHCRRDCLADEDLRHVNKDGSGSPDLGCPKSRSQTTVLKTSSAEECGSTFKGRDPSGKCSTVKGVDGSCHRPGDAEDTIVAELEKSAFHRDGSPQVSRSGAQSEGGNCFETNAAATLLASAKSGIQGCLLSTMPWASSLNEEKASGDNRESSDKDDHLDLLYDPILDCYYDPKTNRYYELKTH